MLTLGEALCLPVPWFPLLYRRKLESLSSPGKEILIVSVGNKLRIGSVWGMHVHVLERGYSLWPTLLFHHSFLFIIFLMQTGVPHRAWGAGLLASWELTSGRWPVGGPGWNPCCLCLWCQSEGKGEERQYFLCVKALDKRVYPTGLLD